MSIQLSPMKKSYLQDEPCKLEIAQFKYACNKIESS